MDRLEDELRRALAREEAPEGFAERVLARRARVPSGARRWLAAAAIVLVAAGAAGAWREHQGYEAKREMMLALRLASAPMHRVQLEVRSISQ
jgi:ferric-dicitrate binding protein FerR (iron transport regulator)